MKTTPLTIITAKKYFGQPLDKNPIKKIIALIFEKNDELLMDLKLSPEHGEEARQIAGVFPGYHMNKTHWNTINVNNTELTYDGLIQMVNESNDLTK